jgi:hypothetical protein
MSKEPAAWLAVATDGSDSSAVYLLKEQADAAAREWGWMVVPLYAFPALWHADEIAIEAAWERTGLKPTCPDDEAGCGVKFATAMADEIERLRLTDEEREAIEWFAEVRKPLDSLDGGEYVATLRKMLGRTNSPQPFAAYAVYINGEYDSSCGPDAIDEAMEIAADCNGDVVPLYRTPQTNATPGECSVLGSYEKSDEKRRVLYTKQEPVAWAILHLEHQFVSLLREVAEARNVFDAPLVPLYRSPTLTDEERDALEFAVETGRVATHDAATLRKLLERLK